MPSKGIKMNWINEQIKKFKNKLLRKNIRRFIIGDSVLYPRHGTGRIVGIQFLANRGKFYRIQMDTVDAKILVPVENMSKVGVVHFNTSKGSS